MQPALGTFKILCNIFLELFSSDRDMKRIPKMSMNGLCAIYVYYTCYTMRIALWNKKSKNKKQRQKNATKYKIDETIYPAIEGEEG